jgi:S-formylglutathione hydrolase
MHRVPILYYLAGLTCNEDTAPWKSGCLRDAEKYGIAMVFPDTSPRGAGVEGEDSCKLCFLSAMRSAP